jgi:hypothetical protein
MNKNMNKNTKTVEDKREKTIQEYRGWLEKFRWDWFATLKITSGVPSERRARNLCDRWVSDVRRAEGAEDFRWFRVLERGASGSNLHFHVLVGGLRNRRNSWERRWAELGGEALIKPYNPEQKGIMYLLKSMGNDGDLACDFELPTKKQVGDAIQDLPPQSKSSPTTIRVDRIDGQTTTTELKGLFKRFGRVVEIGILEARDGDRVSMSATVTLADLYSALEAVRILDGFELRGMAIEVSILGA